MKTLISKNEESINRTMPYLKQGIIVLNKIKKEYDILGLRKLESSDLPSLVSGEQFIKEVLTENISEPEVQGVKISVNKLRDIMLLPENRGAFIQACNELEEYSKDNMMWGFSIKFYTIKNNEIILSQSQIDKFIETNSYFAQSPKELKCLEVSVKLKDAVNEALKLNIGLFQSTFFHDLDLLKFNNSKNEYEVDGRYLLSRTNR
jgi:hypothetical protein